MQQQAVRPPSNQRRRRLSFAACSTIACKAASIPSLPLGSEVLHTPRPAQIMHNHYCLIIINV